MTGGKDLNHSRIASLGTVGVVIGVCSMSVAQADDMICKNPSREYFLTYEPELSWPTP